MTKIIRLDDLQETPNAALLGDEIQGCVVTIGNFDGVHLGHASLLAQVQNLAAELSSPTAVVVLDPHPAAVLRPEFLPPRLTWIERRAELLSKHGVDYLLVCKTTRELLSLTADEFFDRLIVKLLSATAIVEGPNFFFGKGRGGNVETLKTLCDEHSMQCVIVDPNSFDGEMISSTRIRKMLSECDIDGANACLGVAYQIRGQVVHGEHRGRKLGFPTANLEQIDGMIPGSGVYGGVAWVGEEPHQAAIHIGPNPTFDDESDQKIEVHLLDFNGDLYDKVVRVDLIHFVRETTRFESADALKQQLAKDLATIRSQLAQRGLPARQ